MSNGSGNVHVRGMQALPLGGCVDELVIQAGSRWKLIDFRELYAYRDLFLFLTWRTIRVQYAQSALGIGWAIIQPLFQMLVFTIVFGYLARVGSDGAPYPLFSLAALLPWAYFSASVTSGTDSLVSNSRLLTKVYFPRLVMPLSAVAAKLVDFAIAFAMTMVLMAFYGQWPTAAILWLPFVVLIMVTAAAGLAVWLTALAVQYRDVKYGLNFMVQLLMYAAPVVYSAYEVPDVFDMGRIAPVFEGCVMNVRAVYAINPMVGVIEAFRASLLGVRSMPWGMLASGAVSSGVLVVTGLLYFRSRERLFADVA